MNVTDLDDPVAVTAYLGTLGTATPLDDAQALAEDALEFDAPPVGAWTVLAHVAEHRGDYAGLERWTAAALGADVTFPPSVDDDAYLTALRRGLGRKTGAAVRAAHLLGKVDRFSGRHPQLRAQLDLAAEVLGVEVPEPTVAALDVCDTWQFIAFLAFEGGLLHAFERTAASLLPDSEQRVLRQWLGVRHRHVRMVEQRRRRWTLEDLATGERLVADTLVEMRWEDEREGFVLVAPVGRTLAVLGQPVVFGPENAEEARAAMADPDPLAVARTVMRWRVEVERMLRVTFCFPGIDPATVPDDEEALLELVRARTPDAARRSDAGDVGAEAELLLESIVAHRIITRRTLHTWEHAVDLVLSGMSRAEALEAVTDETYAELWERAHGEDAA